VLHFIIIQLFPDSETIEEAQPMFKDMTGEKVTALKSVASNSGAYLSEICPNPARPLGPFEVLANCT
jgi:hypothetical protein